MTFQNQHAKVLRFEISIGNTDADRTLEEWERDLKKVLKRHANNVTTTGAYYIIDGKVCLAGDYDPDTQDRKPGTYPPTWAGGPSEAERRNMRTIDEPVETVEEQPREFVRVTPTRTNERHPDGRRVRRDKGVKRGPRPKEEAQK